MRRMTDSDGLLAASVRRHLGVATALSILLVAGIGGWAVLTRISGAVIASGTVVVETNSKSVQHREGGIVRQIFVRDGDRVEAGDLLVLLDDTIERANFASVTKQLDELEAIEARLVSERDEKGEIDFSQRRAGPPDENARAEIERTQSQLMVARRNSLMGRRDQLREQIVQLEKQIEGYEAQRWAKSQEIAFIREELEDLEVLWQKELLQKPRLTALKREMAQLEGAYGGLVASIAQARQAISEREIQILQVDEQFRADILGQLQDVRSRIAQLEEQRIAVSDQLNRDEIRAPQSGTVHDLAVHTVGGVIAAGETILQIVPEEDTLLIEARIEPVDVDEIFPGQEVVIRFPNFPQRTTPELTATLENISADVIRDEATGLGFYKVRLAIAEGELDKLEGNQLVPGMPAEVFIKTGERSVISYIMKPITDQIAHAMRES
jgi:membrane fusion protein, type I secretion system